MGRIPEETIEAVTAATDIVELISSYIPVKRAGGAYKALCPFHNERTPSFNISPQRQGFHCFGCGESGSAIGFVMKYENIPFIDAVKRLAEKAGIPVIEDAFDPKEDKIRRQRSRLVQLHNDAAEYMHSLLMRSPAAQHGRDYLKSRGFGTEMAKRWMIGWIPEDYDSFLQWAKDKGYKGRELVAGSLAGLRDVDNPSKGLYPKFRNRLMFPIHNDYGDVIAFSGRQLVEDPRSGKYVNSNETPIFKKSRVFFGLDKARKKMGSEKFALLCEGQVDVISCVEAGIENTVAGLGTALTEDHARILKRYTQNATLCFDADTAGYKASEKGFQELVKQGITVKVVKMPAGEDPDTLIKKQGVEHFRELVNNASDFFDFKFQVAKELEDFNDMQVRARLMNEFGNLVAYLPDKAQKFDTLQRVASLFAIGVEEFKNKVLQGERKITTEKKFEASRKPTASHAPPVEQKPQLTHIDKMVGSLSIYALFEPRAMSYLNEQLESLSEPIEHLAGGHILLRILAVRPKCDTPAALHTFLLKLNEPDRMALSAYLARELPEDILAATQDTTSMMISTYLQKREAAIRAALRRTDLTPEDTQSLLQEAQEIAELLRGVSQRFIR